jgi:hypothetical protein
MTKSAVAAPQGTEDNLQICRVIFGYILGRYVLYPVFIAKEWARLSLCQGAIVLNTLIASIQPGQPVIHSVESPTRSQVTRRT